MKLKEAQMLGVLSVIAVAIILLCMWGGNGEDALDVAGGAAAAPDAAQMDADLAELYQELLGSTEVGPAPAPEPVTVQVGGGALTPAPPVRETDTIRDVIETSAPAEIRLVEPEPEPEPVRTAPGPAPAARSVTHTVAEDETLSEISRRYYNTAGKWQAILDANKSVVQDPRLIRPGMRLRIPNAVNASGTELAPASERPVLSANAAGGAARTHVVERGDNLYRLAQEYYGDGSQWRKIHAANRASIQDADRDVKPGMTIVIP